MVPELYRRNAAAHDALHALPPPPAQKLPKEVCAAHKKAPPMLAARVASALGGVRPVFTVPLPARRVWAGGLRAEPLDGPLGRA